MFRTGIRALAVAIALAFASSLVCKAADRINHEGRILGTLPVLTNALLFNTPEADAVVSAMQIFPRDNAWNEDISRHPLLSNSAAMMTQITNDLATNRQTLRPFHEMNFILVPDAQPRVPIAWDLYGDESDPSPYPFATNTPVEGWPRETGAASLTAWQRNDDGGDRHSIAVMPGSNIVWETWRTVYLTSSPTNWHAANGARFNMSSNTLRPLGWTSGDAAGLSMFAGLVRYDECQRGMVEHAVRLVVKRSRQQYIYPASHQAGSVPASTVNVPAMGQRLRLKSSFNIPTNWTVEEKAVLRGLKKYGAIVADNGGFFSISVTPDQRFAANAFSHLSTIGVTNFEVIQTTVATTGPRSPGAPLVHAGEDQTVPPGANATLNAAVTYTNAAPLNFAWKLYAGPTNVLFSATNQTNTVVSFTTPGAYTFLFGAENGTHSPAYDVVVVTVGPSLRINIARSGTNLTFNWRGGAPPFRLERATSFAPTNWSAVLTTNGTNATLPLDANASFFRVLGQ